MENLTFKLYSPLTAELLPVDSEFCQEDELVELRGHELSAYAAAISEQIEREGDRLEQYLDGEKEPYLAAHVKSIRLSVEEHGGELCGCATVVVDADLTERGWNDLQEYLSGQYSDGWGEGFEQRDIRVEGGNLNVHFWQEEHFAFTVEQVTVEPQVVLGEANTPQQTQPLQPAKKYEITDIVNQFYPELHRIRALRQVGSDVPRGALGGFVQSESNLSQDKDEAWLYGESICCENALVTGGAYLTGCARVSGSALITDESEIGENASVRDYAIVSGGTVQGNARVCGNAVIRKSATTHCAPVVEGHATVMGTVSGAVHLDGSAFILPGSVLDNPITDVLAINGTHTRLYSIKPPQLPKAPER